MNEAVIVLQRKGVLQSTGASVDELVSDTKDNFRSFDSLEQHLKCPQQFGEQNLLQIDPDTQRMLIERLGQIRLGPEVMKHLGHNARKRPFGQNFDFQ